MKAITQNSSMYVIYIDKKNLTKNLMKQYTGLNFLSTYLLSIDCRYAYTIVKNLHVTELAF